MKKELIIMLLFNMIGIIYLFYLAYPLWKDNKLQDKEVKE